MFYTIQGIKSIPKEIGRWQDDWHNGEGSSAQVSANTLVTSKFYFIDLKLLSIQLMVYRTGTDPEISQGGWLGSN